jgi:hypothetical protein
MTQQLYATERDLQELLSKHPDLLSADGEPRRWLLISREFGIAAERDGADRWSVDHLFLDEQAIPTLVEVKRSTDTRIRREVVGQMLDYAANALSHWNADILRARFEAQHPDLDPQDVLTGAFGENIDADEFWVRVGTNLAAGRVRLMFVADTIPSELRAIVEFLNQHMTQVEVLAVELRQYVDEHGEHQTLVPTLVGETQVARQAKGRREHREWDRLSWLDSYREQRGRTEAQVVEQLFEWADEHDPRLAVTFGNTAGAGAKVALDPLVTAFTIYPGSRAGYVEMPFAAFTKTRPFERPEARHEIQRRLNEIPEVTIPDDKLDKYPGVQIGALVDADSFDRFVSTVDWVLRDVLAALG